MSGGMFVLLMCIHQNFFHFSITLFTNWVITVIYDREIALISMFSCIHEPPLTVEMPKLAPGEPVPPGFEDVVKRVTQIQATLDSHKSSPLIGWYNK
jgi:hypothetical protein